MGNLASWRIQIYVHTLLAVIARLNPKVRAGIEPRSTVPGLDSMPVKQPRRLASKDYLIINR